VSLDVRLVSRRGSAIDLAPVETECASRSNYAAPTGDGPAWRIAYHDPETGVRWLLFRDDHGTMYAGIDYVRPTCFAEQAIDELLSLCASLDLAPALDGGAVDRATLLEAWAAGNLAAVHALTAVAGQTVPYLAPEATRAWWEYTRHRDSLARVLGDGVFAPTITLVRDPGADAVQRLVSWPDAIPCVLPPCDHVVLLRSRPGDAGRFAARLAGRDAVVAAVGDLLVAAPAAIGGLRMLPPEHARTAAARLGGVRSQPMRRFTAVEPDGFVDVR
jgi:hypothetical protein